ncbi:MAG: hypothetical protein AB4911_23030 [Oscillochloridaceae bacterium umkhey_bin13]
MNEQLKPNHSLSSDPGKLRGELVAGGVLIAIGGLLLLINTQIVTLGVSFLLMLGAIFAVAGIASRVAGWFIPAGIVSGIGLGALLIEGGLVVGENAEGGVFLLAFALGWLSITALTKLFTGIWIKWPLIPAAVMGVIGVPLLLGGVAQTTLEVTLTALGYIWPLALIGGGLWLIMAQRRK